jgi:NAD(P)H-flavin reductase/hemoglobin-like flavoprotein
MAATGHNGKGRHERSGDRAGRHRSYPHHSISQHHINQHQISHQHHLCSQPPRSWHARSAGSIPRAADGRSSSHTELTGTAVDPAALQRSWDVVAKAGDEVPLYFYSHLFLSRPELREMFPISMSAQRDKLFAALGRVISNVDQLGEDTAFLQQLGRDHRRFAVIADHYKTVGTSLLATLQHFLAEEWTPELAAGWAAAYNQVATVMLQAAEAAAATSPAWWLADVTAVERRTLDVAVLQVAPRERYDYQPGQSISVEIPLCPRLWRYFSPANAPRSDGSFELHVQAVDGGQVSGTVVSSLQVGHTVRLGPPVGDRLTRADGDSRDLVMVAGGTGLAPLRAVLEQIDREWHTARRAPQVHLFHGARTSWDLYEHEQLTRLTRRPWFTYTEVISDDPSYPGACGPVGTVAAQSRVWQDRSALVCGSPWMVAHAVSELTSAGMPSGDVRYEELTTMTSARRLMPDQHGQRGELR